MKIVIAPDSYKESLSAVAAANCMEEGVREVFPDADCRKIPIADGGEGTVAAMVAATNGRFVEVKVTGPLGEEIEAFYGVTGDGRTAVIEMAAASGLALVAPERRNPLVTTSRGTGELILHALNDGLREFIIGIGGSATNDAGTGMLQVLGVRFLDHSGGEIASGGGGLKALMHIDCTGMDRRLRECQFLVACDVNNPLTGPNGASSVFGPQKGASPEMVVELDANLNHFATRVAADIGKQVAEVPGAGAAGGMGAAFLAFLNAKLRPGIEIIIDAVGLQQAVAGADLVITGEGRIDGQSVQGKAPLGVTRVAVKHGVPVIGIAGSLGPGCELVCDQGMSALFSLVPGPCSLQEAFLDAEKNLRSATKNVFAVIKVFKNQPGK